MNIETGLSAPESEKLPDVIDSSQDVVNPAQYEKITEKIERLEYDLAESKDGRREERYYWILGIVFLLNLIFVKFLENDALFFVMLVPQLFVLASLAKYLGVDWAVEAMERSAQWISERIKRK